MPARKPGPMSVLEQMDERHGKLKSRLGLFSHLYGGGEPRTTVTPICRRPTRQMSVTSSAA